MKKRLSTPHHINSVSELHRLLSLPKPEHPLVSIIDLKDIGSFTDFNLKSVVFNFYSIWLEKGVISKLRYGQNYFDFDEGSMIFIAPGQLLHTTGEHKAESGCGLIFHPDFIRNYPLAKLIRHYGYFSYAVNEALHLSEKEEAIIMSLMQNIRSEYQSNIDKFSQNVIVSHIELLLQYADRFYNRQFITRSSVNNDLLTKVEAILDKHFRGDKTPSLPTVQQLASQLHVSPDYLSDMLRSMTGQNTQQHIHNKLIERAKEMITTTSLTVSEIAFQLGFEHPQSFNKLFKSKTDVTPLQYRHGFN